MIDHDRGEVVAEIEERKEATGRVFSPDYSGKVFSDQEIESGEHRRFVGGRWEELGALQMEFLVARGLEPGHRLLDVGCGSLRAGSLLVDYLEPNNYYGIDANHSLIGAGYERELSARQRSRLPISNLRVTDRFDADFGVQFDMAIAQSVFTHVSLNHIRLCMTRVAQVMRPGGKFYVTFFEEPPSTEIDEVVRIGDQRPRFSERNVYWYHRSDLEWCASSGPWRFRYVGQWGHPVDQRMIQLTRARRP